MLDLSGRSFGLLIAVVVPGFFTVLMLAPLLSPLDGWLGLAGDEPTVAALSYVLLCSVAAGMALGSLRWLLIDSLHHATGVQPPTWDDRTLPDKLQAFEALVEAHYRYYQFHANASLALVVACLARRLAGQPLAWPDAVLVLLCIAFLLTSRDNLKRYYGRTHALLSHVEGLQPMSNGHHPKPQTAAPPKSAAAQPPKPAVPQHPAVASGAVPQK